MYSPEKRHSFILSRSTSSSPLQPSNHSRSKTFGGDLAAELLLGDDQPSRIERRKSMFIRPTSALHGQFDERAEIQETLKKLRSQNVLLSRSLREYTDKCSALSLALETEREHRQQMEGELKRLSQKNFELFEHNKILAQRDSALHQDISTLITKSQADDWMRNVLEDELRLVRHNSPEPTDHPVDLEDLATQQRHSAANLSPQLKRRSMAITLEHSGPLRAQLTAARDELHVTHRQLDESEKKCSELTDRINALHHNMTQCVDSSAQALDVERELRAEVVQRVGELEEENLSLRTVADKLRFELDELRVAAAAKQSSANGVDGSESSPVRKKVILHRRKESGQFRIRTSKKLCCQKNKYVLTPKGSLCSPVLARPVSFTIPLRSSSMDYPQTPDSSSTLVATPATSSRHTPQNSKDASHGRTFRPRPLSLVSNAPSLLAHSIVPSERSPPATSSVIISKASPRPLALLTSTLSKNLPFSFPILKSDSTLSIDINGKQSGLDSPITVDDAIKRRNMHLRRASAVLSAIARTYGEEDGWVRV